VENIAPGEFSAIKPRMPNLLNSKLNLITCVLVIRTRFCSKNCWKEAALPLLLDFSYPPEMRAWRVAGVWPIWLYFARQACVLTSASRTFSQPFSLYLGLPKLRISPESRRSYNCLLPKSNILKKSGYNHDLVCIPEVRE
jgi:hypothetical protein